MKIQQFYDAELAHASYAILNHTEVAVIDPARDPEPYYDFARSHNATIVAVIETHPHADFVSSHKEISDTTGAAIHVSKLLGAEYPHKSFDEGDTIFLGDISLTALKTPGHSPDSISILLKDQHGNDYAVFTGDTLFVGDVGRPDLRESVGNMTAKREELARQMYHSTRVKLMKLPPEVLVYPAHGAGSLCGKNLSDERSSTIGKELKDNFALQQMSESEFVAWLIHDQPFIPQYFGYDVEVNKKGASHLKKGIEQILYFSNASEVNKGMRMIDIRSPEEFQKGHYDGDWNIPLDGKFETWLGTLVAPKEKFYLITDDTKNAKTAIIRASKIGYESFLQGVLVSHEAFSSHLTKLDVGGFANNTSDYTIVDVRSEKEIQIQPKFNFSLHIPLPELRNRINEIPADKPIVVHCAGGYRSAIGLSIILSYFPNAQAYDLSKNIALF